MEILLLLGIYSVELVCYQVVLKILFQVEVRNRKWMVLGLVLSIIIGVLPRDDVLGKNLLITANVFGVMFISIEGKTIDKSISLVLTLLLLACIDDIFAYPSEKIFRFVDIRYMEHVTYFASKCCVYISVFCFDMIKIKLKRYKKTHINSAIYYIIGLIIGLMLLCLSILNQAIGYFPNYKYMIFCNILNVAIVISIFLLVVFVVYIKNTHERMEQLLKTERLLKESQVSYYKQILKKETDTRQYRHDMVNHLVYLQEVLSQNRVGKAQQYLSSILGGFKKIQNIYYVSGNEMVDTIMNYFFGMLPQDVKIEIKGRCPVKISMEDSDICTIFSNIFQNIVEEINENCMRDAKVLVIVNKGNRYVKYEIINSLFKLIDEKNIDKNGLPKSHKADKRNHGIGMTNIKSAVDRDSGKFEWYQDNENFIVSVVLPIE